MIESIVATKNGNIVVYSTGSTGKPKCYCVHGGMGLASDSLIPWFTPLSMLFDLTFIDLRGCGKSDSARDGSYLFSDFASDIVEVVQRTQTHNCVGIFGHSMGGMIAVETLARFPDFFQFSILANTAIDTSWRSDGGNNIRLFMTEKMKQAGKRYDEHPDSDEILRDLAVAFGPLYFPELSEGGARKEMQKFTYRGDAIGFVNKNCYPFVNLKSEARSIRIPTLVISGREDLVVPPYCSDAIAESVPQAVHFSIEGAGHFPFITCQSKFFEVISLWWGEVIPRS